MFGVQIILSRLGRVGAVGVGGAAAGFFKEIVRTPGQDFMFAIGEFTVGVEPCEFSGDGFGADVPIFLEVQIFFGQAGKRIDDAGVGARIGSEHLPEVTGVDVADGIENLQDSRLDGRLIDAGRINAAKKLGGRFLFGPGVGEPMLLAQPGPIRAFMIAPKVIDVETSASGAKGFEDGRKREAIEQELIDLVANGRGQPSDFALGPVLGSGGLRW